VNQDVWARLIRQQREGRLARLELPGLAVAQALFLARDDLRKRSTIAMTSAEARRLVMFEPDAESRILHRERLARALGALNALSFRAQKVFRLAYERDIPQAEVAERVGLSVQRVRQILCEVRGKVRRALQEHDA
jgi:RNA polymerase sigma-70 factor (ECF subfamily)